MQPQGYDYFDVIPGQGHYYNPTFINKEGSYEAKGYITEARYRAAMDEAVVISREENEFLVQAPYFAEHVRRYLVETYGFDKVYNDGLRVDTTADMELQRVAQKAVIDGVHSADNSVGWRGPKENITLADGKSSPPSSRRTRRTSGGSVRPPSLLATS